MLHTISNIFVQGSIRNDYSLTDKAIRPQAGEDFENMASS